jgi:(E)-4-hydroxy-3-methylbut-2-enyl-diphosphate synthase
VYVDGVPDHKLSNDNLVDELESQIRAKAAAKEIQLAKDAANLIAKA